MADDERKEELETLSAIYPELLEDQQDPFSATLELQVSPARPLRVRFVPLATTTSNINISYSGAVTCGVAHVERDHELSHLPPIVLRLTLPEAYPADSAPIVQVTSDLDWLPAGILHDLEQEANVLWEEYGHGQVLFAYVDYLQQAAERGFDLDQSAEGCLVLPTTAETPLLDFDAATKTAVFNTGTYDCEICLEPKKGSSCYKLPQCGHIFCKSCLQDFYNNAISEGDIASIRCLSPDCGKEGLAAGRRRRQKPKQTLHPRDLLAMGIEEPMVRRYVEMKRKKRLEADKNTVFCPRQWCQGPAKNPRYPPIPRDLLSYAIDDISDDEKDVTETHPVKAENESTPSRAHASPADRLAVCESCSLAFCRICYKGWHGEFARCYPRDPNELSVEEKASYDYILANTSPCPTCNSPTQKTMGCNHMNCYQCNTHFCYLCGAWLDASNPYQHFNKPGTGCYQRLWELEEGDEGQRPGDGRGFGGGRAWEQMAIEAAREAEAQEAAAAAAAQLAEDERVARELADQEDAALAGNAAQLDLQDAFDRENAQRQQDGRRRRQRNPFPARPRVAGAANAVREHERNHRQPVVQRLPILQHDEQDQLRRFVNMAARDEEDNWDSDELDGDDEDYRIK